MVKKKRINISIGKDGKVSIDVRNASGSECLAWTKEVEDALSSSDKTDRTLKDSYYQEETQYLDESQN